MSQQPEGHSEGAPEWMVSYADMITIMMAFFVVLYASTSASGTKDKGGKAGEKPQGGKEPTLGRELVRESLEGDETQDRMQKVLESLNHRFGSEWTLTNCWLGGPSALRRGSEGSAREESPQHTPRPGKGLGQPDAMVLVAPKPDETVVSGGRIYFDEATAALSDQQKKQLRAVAEQLAGKLQKLEIRGHTSRRPLPPGSPFHDHWDLAYARCRAVTECLAANGVDPRRMRLGVAGENEPVQVPNEPLAIRQNSRVEVRTLNEWLQEAKK